MTQLEREFELSDREFDWIRAEVKTRTGITLSPQKRDLVYNRLVHRLRNHGFSNFREYRKLLEEDHGEELVEFTNALTTNVTAFFREPHHFEYLRSHVFPELKRQHRSDRRVRIWSAGCSSGEEPYSIAMTIAENFSDAEGFDVKILATDLDTNVLAHASAGVYTEHRLSGIDEKRLSRWFMRGKGANDGQFRVRDELRDLISFKQLNLMEEWPMRGPFDLIFCRNVIIYFDKATQRKMIDRYGDLLGPNGYLMLGHSESLSAERHEFQSLGKTMHRKVA
ncbi:MAG: protein-glutamate O-methyltransferase CheR [Deltaproteobacteria bacterium]|nr:protein-glutamate O-methyltransferase CheR [Deltaproteobacteria bacterium]